MSKLNRNLTITKLYENISLSSATSTSTLSSLTDMFDDEMLIQARDNEISRLAHLVQYEAPPTNSLVATIILETTKLRYIIQ